MNDEATTATVEGSYTGMVSLTEGSLFTSARSIVDFAESQEVSRPEMDRPLARSTASVFKAFMGHAKIRSSFAAVESKEFFLLGSDKLGWQDEDELDLPEVPRWLEARRKRNAAAIALLEKWVADDMGDDEDTWLRLKNRIEESRTSARKRFSD